MCGIGSVILGRNNHLLPQHRPFTIPSDYIVFLFTLYSKCPHELLIFFDISFKFFYPRAQNPDNDICFDHARFAIAVNVAFVSRKFQTAEPLVVIPVPVPVGAAVPLDVPAVAQV